MLENEALGMDAQGADNPQDEATNELLSANGIPDAPELNEEVANQITDDEDEDNVVEDDDDDLCNQLRLFIEDGVADFEGYYEEVMEKPCTVKTIQFDKHGAVVEINYFTEEELED